MSSEGHHHWSDWFPLSSTRIVASPWDGFSGEYSRHDHDFFEILLVVSGRVTHRTVAGSRTYVRGDVALLRPGVWHEMSQARGLDAYVCCFGPELLRRELAWLLDDPSQNRLLWNGPLARDGEGQITLHLADDSLERVVTVLSGLARLGRVEETSHRAARVGALLQTLDELASALATSALDAGAQPPSAKPHPAALRAIRLLEDNIAEKWTLDLLAAKLQMDPSHL